MTTINESALNALESFGFSSYEARAYLALQAAAPVTGYQLSKQAGVPRSRIYETIERLIEKGYALRIEGDPVTYLALSPEGLLRRIRVDFHRNLQAVAAQLENTETGEAFLHIRESARVSAWIERLIAGAVDHLALHTREDLDPRHVAALRAAARRGVHCITHTNRQISAPGITHFPIVEGRAGQAPGNFYLFVDGKIALSGRPDRATWSRSPEWVRWAEETIRLEIARDQMLSRFGRRAEVVLAEIDRSFTQAGPARPAHPQAAGPAVRSTLRPIPGFRTGEAIVEPVR